jgi:hypothetical protein
MKGRFKMPFTGFNLSYPEYEVTTPHTKLTFNVRSLNVSEEEKMKGSLVSPNKITEHLNKCIYETLVKKPAAVKDFETFLRMCTLKDRDALLYGLYHITYEEVRNYDISCSTCNKQYPVTIQASDTFNFNMYPDKNVLKKEIKIPLPVSKGITAIIRQPSLWDEMDAIKRLSSRPGSSIELITETLIVNAFEQEAIEDKKSVLYNERVDILDAYLTLPARDKRIIHKTYQEEFGKFGVDLKMKTFCPHCSAEEDVDIDLVSQFFRMVYSA